MTKGERSLPRTAPRPEPGDPYRGAEPAANEVAEALTLLRRVRMAGGADAPAGGVLVCDAETVELARELAGDDGPPDLASKTVKDALGLLKQVRQAGRGDGVFITSGPVLGALRRLAGDHAPHSRVEELLAEALLLLEKMREPGPLAILPPSARDLPPLPPTLDEIRGVVLEALNDPPSELPRRIPLSQATYDLATSMRGAGATWDETIRLFVRAFERQQMGIGQPKPPTFPPPEGFTAFACRKVVYAAEVVELCLGESDLVRPIGSSGPAVRRQNPPGFTSREPLHQGDIWIIYDNGYESHCPPDVFLKGYVPLEETAHG